MMHIKPRVREYKVSERVFVSTIVFHSSRFFSSHFSDSLGVATEAAQLLQKAKETP